MVVGQCMSVIEKARELADALKQCPEFVRVRNARNEIESHEAARIMFRDFEKMRRDIEALARKGEEVPQEKLDAFNRSLEIISYNPYIREFLDAEVAFAKLFAEVQETIVRPLGDLNPDAASASQPAGEAQG